MIKLTTQQLAQILNANLIGDGQAVVRKYQYRYAQSGI